MKRCHKYSIFLNQAISLNLQMIRNQCKLVMYFCPSDRWLWADLCWYLISLWLNFHMPLQPTTSRFSSSPTAYHQPPGTCYSPDAPSWGRPCLLPLLLPVWGEPEPAALSGSPPATASGSHPGPRRLHADPQRSGPLCILLQRLWETSTLCLLRL